MPDASAAERLTSTNGAPPNSGALRLPHRADRPTQRGADRLEQFDEDDVLSCLAAQDVCDVVFEPKQQCGVDDPDRLRRRAA
jgi:hypothetical protein